jgi:type IV fimbrial biogenesis protein FimT
MKKASGFSLIELMVVIAIAAVLAALAVPSFQGMVASSNLTSTTNDLVATFARARSDAIRRGKRVTVCMSSDGATCTTSGAWTQGWIMFNDGNHAAAGATVESSTDITIVSGALTNNIVVVAKANSMPYVSYSSDGQAKLMNGGSGAGTIRVCSVSTALANDARARDIKINWVGRVILEKPAGVTATCPAPT